VVTDRDRSVVRWVAVIGAVSGGEVMARFRMGRTAGYRRTGGARRARAARALAAGVRPADAVHGDQGGAGVGRDAAARAARVGVATTRHWATCARLAVQLERAERGEVWGEPRLRAAELASERAIASAQLGQLPDGRPRLRRPDLVLFPDAALPVAIEVELSVKGIPQA
jgi:hypothetical protein